MSLRLFIAIPVPDEIAQRLLTLESDVPGASWRLPEHFHLTLRFLGEIDEAMARDVDHELGQIDPRITGENHRPCRRIRPVAGRRPGVHGSRVRQRAA